MGACHVQPEHAPEVVATTLASSAGLIGVDSAGRDPVDPFDPGSVPIVVGCDTPAAALCDQVESLLRNGSAAVLACDVYGMAGSAADVIDTLARIQLAARRCGGEVRLCRAEPALLALLDLAGLSEVLRPIDEP